ncbi:MAG TPA: AAA family ATPase [Chloroflexota bacterium]|nr:AAA family ATPase [Chloroflexota bacterium]
MATIIAISNQKGGVGKTTTTANLGSALFNLGQRVLMIDMDPQGNLSSAVGVNGQAEGSVAESLLDRTVALPIHRVVERMEAVLDVVPANINLAATEAALMNKLGRELRLRDQLVAFSNDYDFILIDTPPSLGLLTINSLVAADKVIIPTEARLFSLQGLQMLQESIEEILYLNPKLQVLGILLSKLDRRLKEERLVSGYLRDRWGAQVFQTEVGTNSKILEAASSGASVFNYSGAEKAADNYLALAREVIRRG